jgi:threonine synthase
MIVPVGGGGTLAGIHRGFDDLRRFGRTSRVPRLVVVQSDRFNALEIAMARNLKSESELQAIAGDESVETIARNLKHGVPPDALSALAALRASDGIALSVSDEDVRAWQARLAASEAIFCEPSSAASAVALERLRRDGTIARSESAVALITGSAFREMSSLAPREPLALPGNITARELERLI